MSRSLKISIIEDGKGLCSELCEGLKQAGHIVECALSSEVVMAQLALNSPELILLAINAPLGSELNFYQRVTSHRRLRAVPLIVVSTYPDLEYELLDAFDFLTVPLDCKRLQASLNHLQQKTPGSLATLPVALEPQQLDQFKTFINEHAGLHFSSRNQRLLERGLLRRMQALHLGSADGYLAYLCSTRDNSDELNKLLGLLTVGETCFFRYRSHREALLHHAVPAMIEANRDRRQLRIWSAGCSTGEEPFSLAILLLEHFPELAGWDVQILASDINKQSLRRAREGVFGSRSLRLVEPELRQRYFQQSGAHFLISQQVKNMVRFCYMNLQGDDYPDAFDGTQELDLILCRNVLIYFHLETIRQIVDRFTRCLKPEGLLFLGHAETMQGISSRFQRQQREGAFFYQLKAEQRETVTVTAVPVRKVPVEAHLVDNTRTRSAAELEQLYAEAMTAFDHENNLKAEQLFNTVLSQEPEHARALVGIGMMHANRGDYADARRYCARAISRDDLLAEAYLLRGFILDMEGALERALVEYQKVLWLEASFVMAHYLTAKAHSRLGQPEKRLRALRNTLRCLEQSPEQTVPFSGGLSRTVFLEIVHHDLTSSKDS